MNDILAFPPQPKAPCYKTPQDLFPEVQVICKAIVWGSERKEEPTISRSSMRRCGHRLSLDRVSHLCLISSLFRSVSRYGASGGAEECSKIFHLRISQRKKFC